MEERIFLQDSINRSLYNAARRNNVERVKGCLLIKADINYCKKAKTVLEKAIETHSHSTVAFLLQQPEVVIQSHAIASLAIKGGIVCLRFLLDKGMSPSVKSIDGGMIPNYLNNGERDYREKTKLLIDKGLDVFHCRRIGNVKEIEKLIDSQCDRIIVETRNSLSFLVRDVIPIIIDYL